MDAALAEARKAIFAEVSELEWGTPVLYMRSPDGKVFEVEKVSEVARKQLYISSLLTAARTATASNDHTTAIGKLKEALALEPEHAEAATLLADVTREQELAETERAKAAREEELKEDPRPAEVEPAGNAAAAVQASGRRPVSSFFMGGVLGAAAVIAVLVFGGVALVIFMAGQQSASSGSKTPPQNQSGSSTAAPDTPVHPQPSPAVERHTTPPAQTLPRRENPPQRTQSSDLPVQAPPPALSPKQPVASDSKGQDTSVAPEARLPSGSSILERHVAAIGGRDALLSHRSVHASGTLSMPAAGLTGTLDIYGAAPNRTLLKVSFPGVGDLFEGFDGTHAWSLSAMNGPMLLEGRALEEKKFDSEFNSELRSDSRYQSVTTLDEVDFEGRRCYKVGLTRKTGGEDIEFYDVATGLRAGRIATRETLLGPVTTTMVEADYKRFGNLVQPTTVRIQGGGVVQVIKVAWTDYDRVPASIFELPPPIIALVR